MGWGGAGRGSGWQLLRTVLDQEAIERIERIKSEADTQGGYLGMYL